MLVAKDGTLTARGVALVHRVLRAVVVAMVAMVVFVASSPASYADLTIAVPTVSTADIATITAWCAGLVVIAVTARFIVINGFIVVRFITWILSGAFRWARG